MQDFSERLLLTYRTEDAPPAEPEELQESMKPVEEPEIKPMPDSERNEAPPEKAED